MFELKTSMWAYALLRRATGGGAYAVLAKKGDGDAGACLVLVNTLDGMATLYRPIRNANGERVWLPKGPENARELDAYIGKQIALDPDLWVIEIEDKAGRHFLTEPIESL